MIVNCPECRARYEITASPQVLDSRVKVRCPRCRAIFPVIQVVRGSVESSAPPETPTAARGLPRTEVVPPVPRRRPAAQPTTPVSDPVLARRMARAMVSEMLLNRRQERDEALATDTLLSRFGPAIVEAYTLYGRAVSPRLAAGPRIFREAINEILGDGREIL
jgi:predicted Zn finger-like uncharacterized protein